MKINRRAAIKKLNSLVYNEKKSIEKFRNDLEKNFYTLYLPNRVDRQEKKYGRVKCDILLPTVRVSQRVMIYIHGGSFVGGSKQSYASFCSCLANNLNCKVIVPDFRLPPAFPYPAGLEDIQEVCRQIIAEEEVDIEFKKNSAFNNNSSNEFEFLIGADSSGSTIAFSLIESLNSKNRKYLKKLILFSPYLNLGFDEFGDKNKKDELLSVEDLRYCASLYTYAENAKNPSLSVLNASVEQLEGLCDIYIQCGEKEILAYQAVEFRQKLHDAKVNCELDIVEDMPFMFQMADEYLPQAHEAIERIGKFVNADYLERELTSFKDLL